MGALIGTLAGVTAGGMLSPQQVEAAQYQASNLNVFSAASPIETDLPRLVQWAPDAKIPYVGIAGSPAFAVYNNQLYCVHQGTGKDSQTPWYTVYDGFNWSKDTKIENVGMGGAPALAVYNNRLLLRASGHW